MKLPSVSIPSFFAGLASAVLLAVLFLAGCAITPMTTDMDDQALDEYEATLKRLNSDSGENGSLESDQRGLDSWKNLLSDLSVENVKGKASQVYAEETFFNDTIKTLRSGEAIEEYLIETAELLNSGSVEYHDTVRSDDGSYYVRWEMFYQGKKLAGGKTIRTIGMSQLRFDADGRVVFHQDFWDSTRGIFQHIPIVGGQIRFIKKRL